MKKSPIRKLQRLIEKRDTLREALGWVRNRHPGKIFGDSKVRNDVQIINFGDRSQLEVYWKALPMGVGTTVLVRFLGEEIVRFDCFEDGLGHIHTSAFLPPRKDAKRPPRNEIALAMPEKSIESQINRVVFELQQNLSYYKARSANPQIRALGIDEESYKTAVSRAEQHLLNFAQLHCH